jgi:hypothetical protein
MSGQIKITANEFPDIVACYLLECMQLRNEIPLDNELFDQLLNKMYRSGIRANLLWMYMNMDGNYRVKYKLIRDALFNEGNESSLIRVLPDETK